MKAKEAIQLELFDLEAEEKFLLERVHQFRLRLVFVRSEKRSLKAQLGQLEARAEGQSYCPECNEWLDAEQFYPSRSKRNGLSTYCREHERDRKREYYRRKKAA